MSLNKKKQHDETSDQQKTHSETNNEDCFVYDKSRFTGNFIIFMRKKCGKKRKNH